MAIRYSLNVDTARNLDKWKQAMTADLTTSVDVTSTASQLNTIKAILKVYQQMATA